MITNDSHSVGRINAGESLGIGYDIIDEIPGGVGRLEFSFEEGYEDSAPEGSFTVSGVSTQTDEYSTETTFTVASSYEIDLETTYAYAIYRDSGGRHHRRHVRLRRPDPRRWPGRRHGDVVRTGRRGRDHRRLRRPGLLLTH